MEEVGYADGQPLDLLDSDPIARAFCVAVCSSTAQKKSDLQKYFQDLLSQRTKIKENEGTKEVQAKAKMQRSNLETLALILLEESEQLFGPTITPVLRSKDDKLKNLRIEESGKNSLHIAVSQNCPRVVNKLLDNINIYHNKNQLDLKKKVMKAEDTAFKNVLTYAIEQTSAEMVGHLLDAEKELVEHVSMLPPLHLLIRQALDRDFKILPSILWADILERIVRADPTHVLTSACNFADWSPKGDVEPLINKRPYEVAFEAHKALMDGLSEEERQRPFLFTETFSRIHVLEELINTMDELIWRYLEGNTIQKAGLSKLSQKMLSSRY